MPRQSSPGNRKKRAAVLPTHDQEPERVTIPIKKREGMRESLADCKNHQLKDEPLSEVTESKEGKLQIKVEVRAR